MRKQILLVFLLLTPCLSAVEAHAEIKLIDYPACIERDAPPCIESLVLEDSIGMKIYATPEGPTYKSVSEFAGLKSDPATVWQWRTPGVLHENKTELVTLHAWHFPYGAAYCWESGKCSYDIDETIISISASGWEAPIPSIDFPDLSDDKVCEENVAKDYCKRAWSLNKNYRYTVTLKVANDFEFSYSNGEAFEGFARVMTNSQKYKSLIFSGKPVDFSYTLNLPGRKNDSNKADVTHSLIGVYVQTKKSTNSNWISRCDKGKGLSLWYSGQLKSYPAWVAKDSALTLQVESTHLKQDSSKNLGTFNIDMPIETARCLWGVDLSRAVSTTISAVYPELGVSEMITTVSKVEGDFFKVSAAGFHFSAPVIKMTLQQTKPKKTLITCVKGKMIKKVTAANPKCPAGYKKK
jgi:hypothetical protein